MCLRACYMLSFNNWIPTTGRWAHYWGILRSPQLISDRHPVASQLARQTRAAQPFELDYLVLPVITTMDRLTRCRHRGWSNALRCRCTGWGRCAVVWQRLSFTISCCSPNMTTSPSAWRSWSAAQRATTTSTEAPTTRPWRWRRNSPVHFLSAHVYAPVEKKNKALILGVGSQCFCAILNYYRGLLQRAT